MSRLRTNARCLPDRVLVVGVEGVGKSSFAASAPKAAILAAEDGTDHIERDPRFDSHVLTREDGAPISSFADAMEAIEWLAKGEHDRETVIVDSIDWLEKAAWADVCEERGWRDIEAPGYGKGYAPATERFRSLLAALGRCRLNGMTVVLVAHSTIKPFQNPSGHDYSRYEVALHKGAAAVVKEWCDTVLFLAWEQIEVAKQGEDKKKGSATGKRVAHSQREAAWDAKSRWGIPPSFYLPDDPAAGWRTYEALREAGGVWSAHRKPEEAPPVDPKRDRIKELMGQPTEALRSEFETLVERIEDEAKRKQVLGYVAEAPTDISRLAKTIARIEELTS